MSRHERYPSRNRIYSNWHRYGCDDSSTMIDVDGLEYCERCRMPLLLVEEAQDVGQEKQTIVLEKLAQAANVPAVCLLWTPSTDCPKKPPHCQCQIEQRTIPGCTHGVESFRWRTVYPEKTAWMISTALDMAKRIDQTHLNHYEGVHRALRLVA